MNQDLIDSRKEFGSLLKTIREKQRLTLMDLQSRSGIKYSAIAAMEAGTRATGNKSAETLAKALRLRDDELQAFLFKAASTRVKDRLSGAARELSPPIIHYVAHRLEGLGIKSTDIIEAEISTAVPHNGDGRERGTASLKTQFKEQCDRITDGFESGVALKEPLLILTLKSSRQIVCSLLVAQK